MQAVGRPQHPKASWKLFVLALFAISTTAFSQTYEPLTRANFSELVGPTGPLGQGFGDRQNSAPYSMAWFKGHLYVGTNRAYHCMEQAALNRALPFLFPYPTGGLDIFCPGGSDPLALPLQAEIWRWSPSTRAWDRVYQSPADAPSGVAGRFVARDVGFRAMHVFTEPDGTEALYVSGVSSKWVFNNPVAARILRSTDGTNFAGLPQDPGTMLGNLGNASFRGMTTYKNRLYIIAGGINGYGQVLESADPAKGNNSFRPITPASMEVLEVGTYNGYLFVGTNNSLGFELYKTDATATTTGGAYAFTKIIPNGGHVSFSPNLAVISLKEFKGRLYVGCDSVWTLSAAELYRVNPDDTWDVIAGYPRDTPLGHKEPLSGLGAGFGWQLNDHMWRQAVYDDRLYVGTFDLSTMLKDVFFINLLVAPFAGGDLWRTEDGIHFADVDTNGFGDRFSYGIRTMEPTPHGLFIGLANFFYGLRVWLGKPAEPVPTVMALTAPGRLDAETLRGKNLLSWEVSPAASSYQIYRSVSVPQNVELAGNTGTAFVPQKYQLVGSTNKQVYADGNVDPRWKYTYYVLAQNTAGKLSRPSNRSETPLVKGTTFKSVSDYLSANSGRRFKESASLSYVLGELERSRQQVLTGNLTLLRTLWATVKANQLQGKQLLEKFVAEDLELRLAKLLKRAVLFQNGQLTAADL